MTRSPPVAAVRFAPPPGGGQCTHHLALRPGTADERVFPFANQLEIGRDEPDRALEPGLLLVPDPSVSWRHCTIACDGAGRCFVRDLSRNGTRLDGRRLVPNIEVELHPGQRIAVSQDWEFAFGAAPQAEAHEPRTTASRQTFKVPNMAVVSVLVGDIRDYTVLVRRTPSAELQQSVSAVFERLTVAVAELGGTVKEYQGDAIVAFWEGDAGGAQALAACRAALRLDALARAVAADRDLWRLADFPLAMDWAVATGLVSIDSFGGEQRTGLSMVGEPIVLAFRLEKFATPETGPIVACRATHDRARRAFAFRDLGERIAKGFDRADHVFALEGELPVPPGVTPLAGVRP